MSWQAPLTLSQLAIQSLLRDEALAISALQDLPMEFFPPLFKEADTQRKTKMIKSLVADWPYPCLPVGSLMRNPNLETYQAVLDGADTWLKRRFRPRKQKLQVLDMRNVQCDSRDTEREGRDSWMKTVLEKQVVKGQPRSTVRCLKVVIDLAFMSSPNVYQTQLLKWAEERKGFLKLCCVKMEIGTSEVYRALKVLQFLQPEFIKEVKLNTVSALPALASFAPCISKMSNLCTLQLLRIFGKSNPTHKEEKHVTKIISVFSKLNHLQHLSMHDVYFLKGRMEQLFRCLKSPLESLSITCCQLLQPDLESFAQGWNHCQLKQLSLKSTPLLELDVTPLKFFLENIADTLRILDLEYCKMNDKQLELLLPALRQCSQLTSINFYDNDISMDVLRKLLHSAASLSQLTMELYPAPAEVYDVHGYVIEERFSHYCAELMNTVILVRQPRSICFGSYNCYDCDMRYLYEDKTKPCDCAQEIQEDDFED
ncbi:preferentially expressed antigen in melanoma-like protein 7 [Meriones unguiculatus]|uniref:preferentially expressed antigen in melanoma-like protein 7 n=1 Tax=Meriones unguiculatus TaxID=10047 RepID=UPI000B4E9AC0|nr:preferentially expressed antigen in melanoma-like protein 7 [Meriones unguiculatus]